MGAQQWSLLSISLLHLFCRLLYFLLWQWYLELVSVPVGIGAVINISSVGTVLVSIINAVQYQWWWFDGFWFG